MTRGALALIFSLGRSLMAAVPRAFAADFATATRVAIMVRARRVAGATLAVAKALYALSDRIEGS